MRRPKHRAPPAGAVLCYALPNYSIEGNIHRCAVHVPSSQALDGDILSTSLFIGLFALCCAVATAFAFRKERRALGWPVSIATVVERSPQSRFEGSGSMLSFNRDSDHFLEWTVSGRTYRSQLEDRAQIVGAGFKLWRLPPSMEPQRIRYNPAHPSQHFQEAHVGHWKYLGAASAVALVAALLVRLI